MNPIQQTAAKAKPLRTNKPAQARVGNAKRKAACKRVRNYDEAMKEKEIVELPNGWKVTPPSVSGRDYATISIGRPFPDEAYD